MNDPDRQLWSGMLSHLRGSHAGLCRQWFEDIEPLGVSSGVLRLRAHSKVHRDYLQRQCLAPFNDAARTVSQRLLTVQFVGPDDDEAAAATGAREPAARTALETPPNRYGDGERRPTSAGPEVPGRFAGNGRTGPKPPAPPEPVRRTDPGPLAPVINPDYAFENFVVGPGNRLAHAAALAVAANPGRAYNPYFVHGDVGLGKTHLLQAICLRIIESRPDFRIFYTSCEGFMTQFMDAVQAGEMSHFRHTFRDVDVLVIDDIHFLAKRDRTQEEFFHTFNSLYQSHKQIILSSDAPPEEIPDLEERLVSRFKWGLVSNVAPPCYETRVAILKNKASLRTMTMPDEVACYIAARIDTNIRELEGAVVKLQVLSGVEKRPIDLDLAKTALGEEPGRTDRQIQIQVIINAVTDFYGIKVTDLQSKRRQRSIALPRQVCMYLARKHTRHSLEEIGGYFGGRDHTTVMHAVRTIELKIQSGGDFPAVIQSLEQTIKTPTVA
jgi:chromosomal replication initiator protein